jgi:DNA-binding response OmpR family regulator
MSVLTGKNILVVGEETKQMKELKEKLESQGIVIDSLSDDTVTTQKIKDLKAELIFINCLHQNDVCKKIMHSFRTQELTDIVPIFVQVEENEDRIQEVLSFGATDYITPNESTESILSKMKTVFTESSVYEDSSTIDISPIKASVSSTGIRVYVVEDDPLLRNLLSLKLDKTSFPFAFSTDGHDVMPSMKKFGPDVIVLDLMLPGRSGFEVLEDIKGDKDLRNIPVIVFSNRDSQEDIQRSKKLGADAFYVKAMTDLSELIEKIESLVKK